MSEEEVDDERWDEETVDPFDQEDNDEEGEGLSGGAGR